MKLTLVIIVLSLSHLGFCKAYQGVSVKPLLTQSIIENNPPELVLIFNNYSSKTHTEVVSSLNAISGIKLKGYCEKLKCFYFEIDLNVYSTLNDAFTEIEIKTKKFLPVLKNGTSAAVVISNCPRN